MKLIVGLGNPGPKYKGTRHNAGSEVLDELAKEKTAGLVLAKPKTYMNNSGKAVKEMVKYYKIRPEDLWVVHDDIDLPLGEFKISKGRGSAGHKGVQSIINELGTKNFNRIRVGICPESGKPDNVEKFVLEKFSKKEQKEIKEVVDKVAKTVKNNLV